MKKRSRWAGAPLGKIRGGAGRLLVHLAEVLFIWVLERWLVAARDAGPDPAPPCYGERTRLRASGGVLAPTNAAIDPATSGLAEACIVPRHIRQGLRHTGGTGHHLVLLLVETEAWLGTSCVDAAAVQLPGVKRMLSSRGDGMLTCCPFTGTAPLGASLASAPCCYSSNGFGAATWAGASCGQGEGQQDHWFILKKEQWRSACKREPRGGRRRGRTALTAEMTECYFQVTGLTFQWYFTEW
jgi:hypothetical protein